MGRQFLDDRNGLSLLVIGTLGVVRLGKLRFFINSAASVLYDGLYGVGFGSFRGLIDGFCFDSRLRTFWRFDRLRVLIGADSKADKARGQQKEDRERSLLTHGMLRKGQIEPYCVTTDLTAA